MPQPFPHGSQQLLLQQGTWISLQTRLQTLTQYVSVSQRGTHTVYVQVFSSQTVFQDLQQTVLVRVSQRNFRTQQFLVRVSQRHFRTQQVLVRVSGLQTVTQ